MAFSAETVLQQLGGNKFRAMTGANNFTKDDNSITFKLPKAENSIKYVSITLNGMDTYDIKFTTQSGKTVKEANDVYAEDLRKIFTENTGLHTSL